jgi:hypothetical protein
MNTIFNEWTYQEVGCVDHLSFAVAKCASASECNSPNFDTEDQPSFYMVDDTSDTELAYDDDISLPSTSSCRSVTFADTVNIITVSRYADPSMFYNGVDVARFKHELKMERRMQWLLPSFYQDS